jgi:GNAT superfamily N-acetyltransferase
MSQIRPLTICIGGTLDEADEQKLFAGLEAYNDAMAPGRNWAPLWIVGRDRDGEAQAGLRAVTFFDWMLVSFLYVAETYRRQGIGSRLMARAESVARERGVASVYLDTFSFQAPKFYEKHGYREFGRLENLPPGHSRIWLTKRL